MRENGAVVTFRWDGDVWAFPVDAVVEVAARRPVTPVPGMDPRMAGIVTWRGQSLPVVLPRRLKPGGEAPELKSRFLVVRAGAPFAVPVDEPGRVAFALDEGEDVRVLDPGALVGRATSGAGDEAVDEGSDL